MSQQQILRDALEAVLKVGRGTSGRIILDSDAIPLPQNANGAELMLKLAHKWLEDHLPERLPAARPAPVGAVPAPGRETAYAIMEAARNDTCDAYFKARPSTPDTLPNRYIFSDGFQRGFQCDARQSVAAAPAAPELDSSDKSPAVSQLPSQLAPAAPIEALCPIDLAHPVGEKRRVVIASDEMIDGERVLCIAIQDPAAHAKTEQALEFTDADSKNLDRLFGKSIPMPVGLSREDMRAFIVEQAKPEPVEQACDECDATGNKRSLCGGGNYVCSYCDGRGQVAPVEQAKLAEAGKRATLVEKDVRAAWTMWALDFDGPINAIDAFTAGANWGQQAGAVDGERYRFLRNNAAWSTPVGIVAYHVEPGEDMDLTGDAADAAIDAARAASANQKGE